MNIQDIKYDTPIEVSKKQYDEAMIMCRGWVAGQETADGKYYLKLWNMGLQRALFNILK